MHKNDRETTAPNNQSPPPPPGVCIDWQEEKKQLPPINGDEDQFRRVWEEIDSLAYTYIWHLLVSF